MAATSIPSKGAFSGYYKHEHYSQNTRNHTPERVESPKDSFSIDLRKTESD